MSAEASVSFSLGLITGDDGKKLEEIGCFLLCFL